MGSKGKTGNWLLISLVPTGILGFLFFLLTAATALFGGGAFFGALTSFTWLYWWLALMVGVSLKVWGGMETRNLLQEAQGYAERHGWQPIASTQWKSVKRGGLVMTVLHSRHSAQNYQFLLNVELDGQVVSTQRFERPYYAMSFVDYMWSNMVAAQSEIGASEIQRHHAQWQATALPALRAGR